MRAWLTAPFLLLAVPIIGAAVGLAMWRRLDALKVWLLLCTMATLGSLGWAAGDLPAQAAPLPLLALLPIMAFVSLLGQPLHPGHGSAWLLTPVLLGLGLGVLTLEPVRSALSFVLLLAVLIILLARVPPPTGLRAWWGIGTLGCAVVAVTVSLINEPPLSARALAVACAVVLPLFPLHKGYLALLTALPGNLPAFLAVLLPVIGFHGLTAALPHLPPLWLTVIGLLALAGSLYGSLRTLAQPRAASVAAYGSLAFLSILWWSVATTAGAGPPALVYVVAVGLATSGLLLTAFFLRVRHGEIGLRGLSGLAQSMPRLAVLLSLLALAALGFPPFGVFAGFFGMLLDPSFHWSGGLFLIMAAWLTASWYLFDLAQGLLFGPPPAARRFQNDLGDPEFAALTVILVLLVALGIFPSHWFNMGPTRTQGTVVMGGVPPWNK